ncbi:MAG: AAA family ATPase [Candidatus Omnitrophica bacterium]|nr:AAA family ATPase [Candidatus Omnitrophota bacterium]
MYLKRLEVFAFKSFAEKTVLDFQKGISVIVGPNGCGKSNVFDAIRWVLGEQSVRELRGSSMEDVIFNGTDQKPALGFAEVSLIFSNESKILPFEHEEVIVTRRLFRSGESEYLINKNVCRLRDVVEMFLGTGVGAEAYSLIQQGKVDLVVSAKSDERRQIFDEAAGITKYKAKKKEALSKLKETEDNLVRLNDIIVEVKRQIATIDRQAKKAKAYKEEFEQLKQLELTIAGHQMAGFTQELEIMTAGLQNLATKEQEGLRQLEEFNQRLAYETALMEELDEKINDFKAQQIRLDNDIEVNVRQIGFNEERLQNFDETLSRLETDKKAALERCGTHQNKIEDLKAQLAQITESLAASTNQLDEKRRGLKVLMIFIDETSVSIKSCQQKIFALNTEEVRLKNQLTENMKRVLEQNAGKARLGQENSKVNLEKSQVSQKFEAINASITTVQSQLQSARTSLDSQRQAQENFKSQWIACETKIDDLEKSKVFLLSQKDFIAGMQRQYQDNPDLIVEGRFIAPVRPLEHQTGIIGKIKSIQEVAGGYEIVYQMKYVELDLGHMDGRMAALERQLAGENAQKDRFNQSIREHQAVMDEALKDILQQEKKLSVWEAQKSDIELESGKIVTELDLIGTEFVQIESALADLKTQEAALSAQLQNIAGQMTHTQEEIKGKQQDIVRKHQEREDWNVGIVQLEAQWNTLQTQQQNAQSSLDLHQQNLERDLSDISRFDRETKESIAKKIKINDDISNLQIAIDHLKTRKESLNGQFNQSMGQKADMSQRLVGIRHHAKTIEDEMIQAKGELHHLQMRQQELQFNQRALKERLLQTYKIDWDEWQAQPVLPQPNGVLELAVEIERLKKRCESYGAVNLVAIEEFDELKGRFEFLTKQQSDLLTAREQLMSTILKINRTTRQMFTDTFTKVNEEFQIYFRMLFGGGQAQLVLLDPENALESGIDIMARPPGKKLQNISLLSGGEKTLTAIALIFGIFKVNPSPFCVLDEIDAALDESNIGRFVTLLKEFAKIAQFIVITHNKKTMEAAHIMYGVTMQERGVSRIVSVKFNQYHPQTPPAKAPQPMEAVAVV